jgi:hypothetical protein
VEVQFDLGSAILCVIGFLIVYVLNGIKKEISDVKDTVNKLSNSLVNLDKRVIVLETLQGTTNGHLYAREE